MAQQLNLGSLFLLKLLSLLAQQLNLGSLFLQLLVLLNLQGGLRWGLRWLGLKHRNQPTTRVRAIRGGDVSSKRTLAAPARAHTFATVCAELPGYQVVPLLLCVCVYVRVRVRVPLLLCVCVYVRVRVRVRIACVCVRHRLQMYLGFQLLRGALVLFLCWCWCWNGWQQCLAAYLFRCIDSSVELCGQCIQELAATTVCHGCVFDAYPNAMLKKRPPVVWSRGEVDCGALCVRTYVGRCALVCARYAQCTPGLLRPSRRSTERQTRQTRVPNSHRRIRS